MVLLAAAVLALGGCGRKGPLDMPPTGSQSSDTAPTPDTDAQRAATPSVFNSTYGTDAPPTASKGTKKPFILDPLLDSH
jgi:predicted small lipoprotein YifL